MTVPPTAVPADEQRVREIEQPLCDAVFRARLLRQGLSTDEMAQYVEAVESLQANAVALLRLREQEAAEADERLDEVSVAISGPDVEDALGYVEQRREVLGPQDPLMVLAATGEAVLAVFSTNRGPRPSVRAERDAAVREAAELRAALRALVVLADEGHESDEEHPPDDCALCVAQARARAALEATDPAVLVADPAAKETR